MYKICINKGPLSQRIESEFSTFAAEIKIKTEFHTLATETETSTLHLIRLLPATEMLMIYYRRSFFCCR